MNSKLFVTPKENLQESISRNILRHKNYSCVYISLNKTTKTMKKLLGDSGVDLKKLFFIDGVSEEKTDDEVLYFDPAELDLLKEAIEKFTEGIKNKKFILVDSLATLLIYNDENTVAQFVKKLTAYSSEKEIEFIAFSPKTKIELLNKIFNFFDEVKKE